MVIPKSFLSVLYDMDSTAENMAREDSMLSRVPLNDGEVLVSVLTGFFDGGPVEKQFIAYRNLLEIDSPIYLTFIDYDEVSRSFVRLWSAQTAASRPGTVTLHSQDILGDRSVCVLVNGINGLGQHTLTIFRKNPSVWSSGEELFTKIAELRIDGNITVNETSRSSSYQTGQSLGDSFTISAFGRDTESSNILDQLEISYMYNKESGVYEANRTTRIPGSQVEQRRVRELLSNRRVFEEFISGLWYYITPQGKINKEQYIYFTPSSREIIFYGDETQQVFNWLSSAATRYGLYVSSQNISVGTLRRSIDIELESLDSIRIRVREDVRLKFGVNTPWDGSYQKAEAPEQRPQAPSARNAHIDAWYDGPIGKIHFRSDGFYLVNAGNNFRQGKYAFYRLDNYELLELRSTDQSSETLGSDLSSIGRRSDDVTSDYREIYLVESDSTDTLRKNLTLLPARIGSRGIERLHERAIALTLAGE